MDDGLLWLPDHIRDQRRTPEIPKGTFTVFTHRPDGAFAPTSGIFSAEQTASLRAELSVPACWVLETLFYDLRVFGDDLKGYRAVIHGVRVLPRDLFTAPSGQVGQLYSLNGGDLEVAPGGTVPLYPCFTLIDEQSRSVVLGIPDNAEELRAAGRLILHFVLLTLSIRIRYQGSSIF